MGWSHFEIGGIVVLAFVPGLVQFIKTVAKLQDAAVDVLTVLTGTIMCKIVRHLHIRDYTQQFLGAKT